MANRNALKEMKNLEEYRNEYGIDRIVNDYGEERTTNAHRIIFDNGWCASIVVNMMYPEKEKDFSVALADWNGHFDWCILDKYGADNGCFYCNTEDEIIEVCEIIRGLM